MRAEAVVDLAAIRGNLETLSFPGVQRMAVVKADAYGHGAVAVSAAAREAGAEWLGVALPSEALALRAAGDSGRILAWLYTPGEDFVPQAVRADVDLAASSGWALQEIADAAASAGLRARVHLKIDTGLGRGGAAAHDWTDLLAQAQVLRDRVNVVGIWSHLASADVPHAAETSHQIEAFDAALAVARRMGFEPEVRHLASSGAAMTRPDSHYDLVRLGIAMYGVPPGPGIDCQQLTAAMTVQARVSMVKRVAAGHGVSYGLTWRAPRDTTLALVPMGYADGIPRTAKGAQVQLGSGRFDIVGRIAMDQFVIDVGDADVAAGDDVLIWGSGANGEPTANEWAEWDSTIGYEIVTRLGGRVPRRHVGA